MKRAFILQFLLLLSFVVSGQKYKSEKGLLTFFSDGVVEDIAALNTAASSLFNSTTKELAFVVPNIDFYFRKSLMREHFNEKYIETEKYPNSTFQGSIDAFDEKSTEEQDVIATGMLTIHGVTKNVSVPGRITFANEKVKIVTRFTIRLEDYKIKIPAVVWQNIAEEVELKLDFIYGKL